MAENTRNLTEGSVARAILIVSAPMSLGILAVLSVGIADSYFLGKVGQTQLAAVGYIFPVTTAITSLSIGLSAGANTALSQALGREEDDQTVQRKAMHAVGLGSVLGVLVALAFWLAAPFIFGLMGAKDAVLDEVLAYVPWWSASYPLLVATMIANAAFRAHGDGLTAAVMMTGTAIINIGITPVFVFGLGPVPELTTEGAAIGTFVARAIFVVVALWWAWRQDMIGYCGSLFDDLRTSITEIVRVGLPASLSNAINPAGMAVVTAAVATLGEAAVAGFGAATRVQSVAIVALLALSAGIGPVVGQNWGADKEDRVRRAVWVTFGMCLAYGLAVALVLFFFATPIATLIASEGEAAEFTARYLSVVGWSLAGYGILVTANAAMNARDKALWSMSLSLARIFLIYIPGAWVGVTLAGYTGVLIAAVAANVLAIWGAVVACRAVGLLTTDVAVVRAPAERLGRLVGAT